MGGILFIFGAGLMIASFILVFVKVEVLQIGLSLLTAIFFGFYIIYDIQLIMGGKKYELGIDDYIYGALILYIDIIGLFLEILRIMSKLSEKN